MPALQEDPDIRQGAFRIDEKLMIQQIRFVGSRLRDERLRPIDWSEWSVVIDATYSCGFVCGDAGEDLGGQEKTPVSEYIRRLESDVGRADGLSLRELRRILHYIIGSERWGDAGGETGGGAVWRLITSRLGDAIASRLGA